MRQIPIFVSSTFSDMHRERDLLHQIAGLINRDIYLAGYQVVLKDLRYGIDTASMDDERAIEKKILSECFDAINECKLFVLLLGDRYGSVFEDLSVPRKYMPEQKLEGKSVTHMEVEYGLRRIPREGLIVFFREFQGDVSKAPARYRENGVAAEQNRQLKAYLEKEVYEVRPYDSYMENGEYKIDEYVFLKHMQGAIYWEVKNYIRQHREAEMAEQAEQESWHSENLHEALQQEIDRKLTQYPEPCRECAKELILLRVQDLLHQGDYDEINRLGADGEAILEYRLSLVTRLPDDFVEMLREICGSITAAVGDFVDVFALLQALACAQSTELIQMGGISLEEMMLLTKQADHPRGQTCDEWLEWRYENSGIYRQQLPEQRALACLLGKDVLLTRSQNGYLLKNQYVVTLLREKSPAEYILRIQEYIADVFWYLPDPIRVWRNLLSAGSYGMAFACLQTVNFGDRFSDSVLESIETDMDAARMLVLLEELLLQMIEHGVEEAYIVYVLTLCRQISDSRDSLWTDEWYQQALMPIYHRVYMRLYEKCSSEMTPARQYLLTDLYNTVEVEKQNLPMPQLPAEQMEEAERVRDALLELFCRHDLTDGEDMAEYMRMVADLRGYLRPLDQFLRLVRVYAADSSPWMSCLCDNLKLMTFMGNLLSKEEMMKILRAAAGCCRGGEDALGTIGDLSEFFAEYAYKMDDEELCVFGFQLIDGIVHAETVSRRAKWVGWIRYILPDSLIEMHRKTDDAAVRRIAQTREKYMLWMSEELEDADNQALERMEAYYAELRKNMESGITP